jgi:hypothetical protein
MNLGLEVILTYTKPHIHFVHPLTVRLQWRKHIFVLCFTASMSSRLRNDEPHTQCGHRAVDWVAGEWGFDYCQGRNYLSLCHHL